MDVSSMNVPNPILKPFQLMAIATFYGREQHPFYCIKKYYLLSVLNLLPINFIGAPKFLYYEGRYKSSLEPIK